MSVDLLITKIDDLKMREVLPILGSQIRSKREALGLSQESFADSCGFDRTYISLVERGQRNISFTNLMKIAEGLGLSVSELTKGIRYGVNPE